MKKTAVSRFLEFEGKRIDVLLADGTWHIAVRPICEVLNVDYHRQYKNLQDDEILGQLLSKQTTVGADGRMREMDTDLLSGQLALRFS